MNWISANKKPEKGEYLTRVKAVYVDKEVGDNGTLYFYNINNHDGSEWDGQNYAPKICESMEITHYAKITPPK